MLCFSASFTLWTTICLAVWAATLPKSLSGNSLSLIVSPSSIPSTSLEASSNDISKSGFSTVSTTVLYE